MTKRSVPLLQLCSYLCLSLLFLSGCASVPGPANEKDPFESYNRAMFSFNEKLDKYILKPVAEGYDKVMPDPVKNGVSNFFSNLGDIFVILNDILQFKFGQAMQDTSRFITNTTLGFFGLMDVATPIGLPKHDEDFGQTLGAWGVGDGPYIVWPIFGPSTARDTVGLVGDWQVDPVYKIDDNDARVGAVLLRTVDTRYNLLKASRVLDEAALDRYAFVRDAYLQLRRNRIHDGNPPKDKNAPPPPKATQEDMDLEKELEKDLEKSLEKDLEKDLDKQLDAPAKP